MLKQQIVLGIKNSTARQEGDLHELHALQGGLQQLG